MQYIIARAHDPVRCCEIECIEFVPADDAADPQEGQRVKVPFAVHIWYREEKGTVKSVQVSWPAAFKFLCIYILAGFRLLECFMFKL
jgi:hypothetical protein